MYTTLNTVSLLYDRLREALMVDYIHLISLCRQKFSLYTIQKKKKTKQKKNSKTKNPNIIIFLLRLLL